MKTSCEHCIFAIKDKFIQTGCLLDRLNKFNYSRENLYCIVDGFCNACRTPYWEPYKESGKVTKELIEKLEEEIAITYSVLVYYDGDRSNLIKTLTSCRNGYSPANVVVCMEPTLEEPVIALYDDMYQYYHPLIINQSQDADIFSSSVYKASGAFLYCTDSGTSVNKSVMIDVNKLINTDMKPVYFVKGEDFSLVHKALYQKYVHSGTTIAQLYHALSQSNLKDGVINWPLQ